MGNSELISAELFPDLHTHTHTQKKLDNDSACDLTFKNLTNAALLHPPDFDRVPAFGPEALLSLKLKKRNL